MDMRSKTIIHLFALSLLIALALVISSPTYGQVRVGVGVAITIAPPELPVYDLPLCPGDDYIWTPGYWAWGDDGYFWVPGTWVLAPDPGLFWTPGYWAWQDAGFAWIDGYWGPEVGFYGGVDYGFGYFGVGFVGGRWNGGHFFYNTAVLNVNTTVIHNTYNTVVEHNTVNRVSFNGGNGGLTARPSAAEEAAARDHHTPPVEAQTRQVETARSNPQLRASENHGKPPVAATAKPGEFSGGGVVAAREGGRVNTAPAGNGGGNAAERTNPAERPDTSSAVHPKDLPPVEHQAAPNTGDANADAKYAKQQQKLEDQQNKDRQKLQAQQEKQDQKLEKQNADATKKQAQEKKHQQQTQQLVQRHQQQTQHMQQQAHPATPPHPAAPPHPAPQPHAE
jgi:hypothetical protein